MLIIEKVEYTTEYFKLNEWFEEYSFNIVLKNNYNKTINDFYKNNILVMYHDVQYEQIIVNKSTYEILLKSNVDFVLTLKLFKKFLNKFSINAEVSFITRMGIGTLFHEKNENVNKNNKISFIRKIINFIFASRNNRKIKTINYE